MLLAVLFLTVVLPPTATADKLLQPKNSLTALGGVFTTGSMGESLNAFAVGYEQNYIAGAVYEYEFFHLGYGVLIGGQVGAAARFGDANSTEFWGGATLRYRATFGGVAISPALTFGLSGVTAPTGIERARELKHDGDASLLFYLSPEIAIALASIPNVELVYQLHHRSGAKGTLGQMHEGHNAVVGGIRVRF